MTAPLTVERAAILWRGIIYSVPRPGRHSDVIAMMVRFGFAKPIVGEQGFVLSDGRFARRKPAMVIALRAGQVTEDRLTAPAHGLFSEDLY